jgi:hypothetical protein
MGVDGTEADRQRGNSAKRPSKGEPRRESAKPPGGGKRTGASTLRVQYHLSVETVERIGVHCSLVHRRESAVVEEALLRYLAVSGKGQRLFDRTSGGREDSSPDTQEDRQDTTAA